MNRDLPTGEDLRGLRVVVMGLGQFGGGLTVAQHLARHGAVVCVTDQAPADKLRKSQIALRNWPIRFVLGRHEEADFFTADLVVANPAVPPRNPYLQLARDRGIPITSEMELFLHTTRAQLFLVSGTHGKSSTVTFLDQLLRDRGRPVFLGGNIGRSLLEEPDAMEPEAQCILEISSYQLEAMEGALPKVQAAGLTALAPDHLERHGSLPEYLRCKAKVFDWLPGGAPALVPFEWWERSPFVEARQKRPELAWKAYGPEQDLGIRDGRFHSHDTDLGALADFHEHGAFQQQNLLLALGLAHSADVPGQELAHRLPALTGLPHRLRRLASEDGPIVYDNGVSTTPETTLAAVLSLPAPLVLLVGGQIKSGLDYSELAQACADRGDRVHLFGAACEPLAGTFRPLGDRLTSHSGLDSAIQAAWRDCQPDRILLFSPACASFDEFSNFRARAEFFLERIASYRDTGKTSPPPSGSPFHADSHDL